MLLIMSSVLIIVNNISKHNNITALIPTASVSAATPCWVCPLLT